MPKFVDWVKLEIFDSSSSNTQSIVSGIQYYMDLEFPFMQKQSLTRQLTSVNELNIDFILKSEIDLKIYGDIIVELD